MSRYDWSMMLATFVLVMVALLMGCKPWNMLKRQLVEKIDIDISIDYCPTDSEEPDKSGRDRSCVPLIELNNIEEFTIE